MFDSIRLKNFKAYRDSGSVPLKPLTIFIGTNNSGKSTLLHAILGLVQTARDTAAPRFVTKGIHVDLNGYYDIIHNGRGAIADSFEIELTLSDYSKKLRRITDGRNGSNKTVEFKVPDRAEISFYLDQDSGEIGVRRSTLWRGSEKRISAERVNNDWKLSSGISKPVTLDFLSIFPFCNFREYTESPPLEILNEVAETSWSAEIWKDALARHVGHIKPIRQRLPWQTSVGIRTSAEFSSGGENLVAELASAEKDPITQKSRLETVNEWLRKQRILKTVRLEVDKKTNWRALVGDEFDGASNINIAAMGEGVSQILPIIADSWFGMKNDCLLVEQPEIHLHPALQAELGDLFIDVAQSGHRQIIVETHSEHLLLRVRRRIAEGKLDPNQVAILFVEKDGGESTVRRLDLNSRGHFSDWPKGFFDEAYQEAMALATAASKKG